MLQGACFCRAGHPLLKKSVLQPAELRPYSFVLPSLSHLHAGLIQDFDAGLTADPGTGDPLSLIAVSSASNAAEIVAGTDSLSIGHVGQVKEGVAAGRFAILNLRWRKALPAAEMGVAYKRERTLPPSARTFINLICKRIRVIEE